MDTVFFVFVIFVLLHEFLKVTYCQTDEKHKQNRCAHKLLDIFFFKRSYLIVLFSSRSSPLIEKLYLENVLVLDLEIAQKILISLLSLAWLPRS